MANPARFRHARSPLLVDCFGHPTRKRCCHCFEPLPVGAGERAAKFGYRRVHVSFSHPCKRAYCRSSRFITEGEHPTRGTQKHDGCLAERQLVRTSGGQVELPHRYLGGQAHAIGCGGIMGNHCIAAGSRHVPDHLVRRWEVTAEPTLEDTDVDTTVDAFECPEPS